MNWYEFDSENESLDECRDRRLLTMPTLSPAEMEVLHQCRLATWDGNIASKSARTSLLQKGLLVKFNGWQVVSLEGLAILEVLNALNDREVVAKR